MHLELIILEGVQAGRSIAVKRTPMTFGRSPASALSFPLDVYMSGMHLTVHNVLCGIVLLDMRSSNGTFLNGERVSQAIAVPGDVISIGKLTMRLAMGAPSPVESAPVPEPEVATAAPLTTVLLNAQPIDQPFPQLAQPIAQATQPGRHSGVLSQLNQSNRPLYCLVDAGKDLAIARRLEQTTERRESLEKSASLTTGIQPGPYLVLLPVGSALLEALVESGWGRGWTSFFTSPAPFEELREHFSRFYQVQVESGKIYFRFYDPIVLRDFLLVASSAEVTAFFGPVSEWILEAEDGLGILRAGMENGSLVIDRVPARDSSILTE